MARLIVQAETRWDAGLENLQPRRAAAEIELADLFAMRVLVAVMMMVVVVAAAAQQPGARGVDGETERGDRNCFGEIDRARGEKALDRLDADAERDDGEDERARIAGEIAELARAEGEGGVFRRAGAPACRRARRAAARRRACSCGSRRQSAPASRTRRRRRSRRSS